MLAEIDSEEAERAAQLSAVLESMQHELEVQASRIDNWSGRLVGLANIALVGALLSTRDNNEWWYEWVNVGGKMCEVCAEEGAQGFRQVTASMPKPGLDTLCGARCRCTLVFWTAQEVRSGSAQPMSFSATSTQES